MISDASIAEVLPLHSHGGKNPYLLPGDAETCVAYLVLESNVGEVGTFWIVSTV